MPDATTTVAVLRDAMRRFAAERNWEPFHSPKNLSMGVAVEAAELMEHFLWMDNETSRRVVHDADALENIADEIADVACYLLAQGNTLGMDLSQAVLNKLAKNCSEIPGREVPRPVSSGRVWRAEVG
jgi:dCTP diphosphatase